MSGGAGRAWKLKTLDYNDGKNKEDNTSQWLSFWGSAFGSGLSYPMVW
ncbi:hypothetical protein [Bartonella elizabethae]|nr:hypothetical protein [Bartonella elizabethae]